MRTIYKYPLIPGAETPIPHGSKVVHAGPDPNGVLCVWVECDPREFDTSSFSAFGTGHEIPDGWTYGATVKADPFMWHVYYKEKE